MRLRLDHFGLIAHRYDRWAGPADERLFRLLDARAGQRLLDVGGGTGRNTVALAAAGVQVTVCDVSRRMAEHARAKGLPVTLGSVTRLPFPDGSMERVLVVDAFHHFVDPSPQVAQATGAAELLRVLAPGGRLLVEEPDISQRAVRTVRWIERLLLMGSRFLPGAELIQLFRAAGGRLIEEEQGQFNVWLVFTV